jgi:hypothetical protein
MCEGKYSIELFRVGGEGAGLEKILVRHDSLTVARALYKVAALNCSERLIPARGGYAHATTCASK